MHPSTETCGLVQDICLFTSNAEGSLSQLLPSGLWWEIAKTPPLTLAGASEVAHTGFACLT